MTVNLPQEVQGLIAGSIRENRGREFLGHVRRKEWHKENRTLRHLALVSKSWLHEAIPVLWSDLQIPNSWGDNSEGQITQILDLMKRRENPRAVYVRQLTIVMESFGPISGPWYEHLRGHLLPEILSQASHLRSLIVRCESGWGSLMRHLGSLQFNHLTLVYIQLSNYEDHQTVLGFLRAHPNLKTVRVDDLTLDPPPSSVYSVPQDGTCILPCIRTLKAKLPVVKLLQGSQTLTCLAIYGMPDTLSPTFGLFQLLSPFPRVIHLELYPYRFSLEGGTWNTLARVFPALESLDGLVATEAFIVSRP